MDMNAKVKQNRQLLMNKRQRRARMRRLFYTSVSDRNAELKSTDLSAVELEVIKMRLREQFARERRREITVTVIVFTLAVILATSFVILM